MITTRWFGAWAVVAMLCLSGCGTPGGSCTANCSPSRQSQDIEARDNGMFLPSATVAIDLSRRGDKPASLPRTSHAVEATLTGGRGSGSQEIAGEPSQRPVIFGGERFSDAQTLRYDFEFRYVELLYRGRYFFGRNQRFGLEGLFGAGHTNLEMRVTGATQSASESIPGYGVVFGAGAIWNVAPSTSLQFRSVGFSGIGDEDVSGRSHTYLQVVYAVAQNAAVRAGYAWWDLWSRREEQDANLHKSPIRVRARGPALGLELMF